jgi:hypothetical protein
MFTCTAGNAKLSGQPIDGILVYSAFLIKLSTKALGANRFKAFIAISVFA